MKEVNETWVTNWWEFSFLSSIHIIICVLLKVISGCLRSTMLSSFSVSEQDEEICKIQGAIAVGMVTNASYLQTYLKTWDKHREIWEIEKDGFIQRYQRLNPTVTSFDADIARSVTFLHCLSKCVFMVVKAGSKWSKKYALVRFVSLWIICSATCKNKSFFSEQIH